MNRFKKIIKFISDTYFSCIGFFCRCTEHDLHIYAKAKYKSVKGDRSALRFDIYQISRCSKCRKHDYTKKIKSDFTQQQTDFFFKNLKNK